MIHCPGQYSATIVRLHNPLFSSSTSPAHRLHDLRCVNRSSRIKFERLLRTRTIESSMTTPPTGDGATAASNNRPLVHFDARSVFLLLFVFMFKFVLTLNTCTWLVSLTIVTELLLNFTLKLGIKIWSKSHNYLTNLYSWCMRMYQ